MGRLMRPRLVAFVIVMFCDRPVNWFNCRVFWDLYALAASAQRGGSENSELAMFAPATSPPRLSTLILMTALSVLTLNMYLPSLANIATDLNTSYAMASLSISGYLAITAALQLIIGPLADRYGRRPVLLVATVLFLAASVVAATATDISVFLGARVVQGAIIAGATLASAIITDTSGREKAASLMSYVAMAMSVAPMLGPLLGGALDQAFGWRSGFWLYVILGTAMLWLVWTDIGETNRAAASTLKAQFRSYGALVKARRFWGYSICVAMGVSAFYLFISSAPLVGQAVFGLNAAQIGVGVGSMTAGFFLGSFISARMTQNQGVMRMVLAGRVVALAGLLGALLLIFAGFHHPAVFFGGAVVAGMGNGLTIPSARAGSLALYQELAGGASGLGNALSLAAGALLTLLPGLLLTPENGVWLTLSMMLAVKLLSFSAAIFTWRIDQQEAKQT